MFKFGDRVKCICYNDAKTEGLIMATTEDCAFVMFKIKQDTVLNAGFEYKCDIYFDNTNYRYAYNIPVKYLQKVEPKKAQHNDNNLFNDNIVVTENGEIITESKSVTDICNKLEKLEIRKKLYETLKSQSALHSSDTTFILADENNDQTPKCDKKRKPNKLRKLIKKTVKAELKKMLKRADNE